MTEQPKTVRDIEWHVSTAYLGGFVYAEDQYLFPANRYAQQVVDEHNSYLAMRERLAALVDIMPEVMTSEFGWPVKWYACCGGTPEGDNEGHYSGCPWLLAKQLLDALTVASESL